MKTLNDELQNYLLSNGASLVGFADLSEIDSNFRDGFPFAVSIAIALNPQIMLGVKEGPTRAYFEEYKKLNTLLDNISQSTEQYLKQNGYNAEARLATLNEDKVNLYAKVQHKTVATRAGLGWIGKCALLVNKKYGSAVRLTTVLTNAPLSPGKPINTSLCGDCTDCVRLCPAQAISGADWQAGVKREVIYNAFACREMAQNLSLKGFGEKKSLCGLCIVSCPWTKKYLNSYS